MSSLQSEIETKRKETVTDSYSMSIGEIINIYEEGDLDIHPEFQRFFRWTQEQKSKLIESIFLGIPLPSFFMSQREDGVWDVVDGLQRLSTIFSFLGIYRDNVPSSKTKVNRNAPLELVGTEELPILDGLTWATTPKEIQRAFKREKIQITIVKKESNEQSKYELFQRLNTNGSSLSDQEVRNCILIMENHDFYEWFSVLSNFEQFKNSLAITDRLFEEQYHLELLSRFIVFTNVDVGQSHELRELGSYITDHMRKIASTITPAKQKQIKKKFNLVFSKLYDALEDNSFRKYGSDKYQGAFKITIFEVLALGMGSLDVSEIDAITDAEIKRVSEDLSSNPIFMKNSGAGKNASARLGSLIKLGKSLFTK